MFFGFLFLFFGSFVYSAYLVELPLGQNEWEYALSMGAALLGGPLTTLVVFWRRPKAARAEARRHIRR